MGFSERLQCSIAQVAFVGDVEVHGADGINGPKFGKGVEGKDGMPRLVGRQFNGVRPVSSVDLQQQRLIGNTVPVLVEVGHSVERL